MRVKESVFSWSKQIMLLPFLLGSLLIIVSGGCSKVEENPARDAREETSGSPEDDVSSDSEEQSAAAESVKALLSAMRAEGDGPTIDEAYPQLASGCLVHARLEELPGDVLLEAGEMIITRADIEAEIDRAPPEIREELRKNAFFLLEQIAAMGLLVQEAGRVGFDFNGDEDVLLQSYFQILVQGADASERDIAEFYAENREMIGGAAFEQVKEQIRQHLIQQKQQQAMERHIRTIAMRIPVAVSAGWAGAQAELAKDNLVDSARSSGMPTLASFGADTCVPCQMMAPTREAVRKKYEGRANVVYVHVGEEQILAARYGVQGIPLLVFFDSEGREFYRYTGVMSREQIEEQFRRMGVKQ